MKFVDDDDDDDDDATDTGSASILLVSNKLYHYILNYIRGTTSHW